MKKITILFILVISLSAFVFCGCEKDTGKEISRVERRDKDDDDDDKKDKEDKEDKKSKNKKDKKSDKKTDDKSDDSDDKKADDAIATIEDYFEVNDLWWELDNEAASTLSHYPELYQDVKIYVEENTYIAEFYLLPGLEDEIEADQYNYQDWDGAQELNKQRFMDECGIAPERSIITYYTSEGEVFFRYDSDTFVAPEGAYYNDDAYVTLEQYMDENEDVMEDLCSYFGYTDAYVVGNTLFVSLNPEVYTNPTIPELVDLLEEGEYDSFVEEQFADEEMGIFGTLHGMMGYYETSLSVQVTFVDNKGKTIKEVYYTEGYFYDKDN